MATLFTASNGTNGQELWVTHGTASSTFLLKDIRSGAAGSAPQLLGYLLVAGVPDQTKVLFLANDGTTGAELWVTDGTTAGTVQFKDLNAGAAGSFPGAWTGLAANAVFAATDAANGRELWASDGTAAGTTLLTDLNPGAASSDPAYLGKLIANGVEDATRAMFVLTNGTSGREIWVTDGTSAGTTLLKDINPGAGGSDPSAWQAIGTRAVFVANNGTSGRELWTSDGSTAGTVLLTEAAPGLAGSDPEFLGRITTPGGQRLVYALNDITNGRELWVTDGTPGGTALFKDINPGAGSADPGALTSVGGRVVFVANDGTHGAELWASDGTAAGTALVLDVRVGADSSAPELRGNLIVGGTVDAGKLLVLMNDGTNGAELWTTDGTAGGTALFKDINPGAGSATVSAWTAVNGRAVFVADDGAHGAELWVSDGTSGGTALLSDLRPGAEGSNPTIVGYVAVNGVPDPNQLLVLLDDGTSGQELWVTNGTAAGTKLWTDANPGAAGSFATDTTMEVMASTIDLTAAAGPVTIALGEAGSAQDVTGSAFADAVVGNEKANTIISGDGDDVILTVGGDDTIDAGPGNDLLNGGAGANTAIFHGIRGASEIRFDSKTFDLTVVGPDGVDTLTNMQILQFTDMTVTAFDNSGVRHLVNVSFPATSTDQFMIGNAYTGPVPGLTDEFIFPTPQNINIASALPNSFIRTGTGDDAIAVFTGNNVVDAYQGSNFLTSGTGNDTFFVDARGGGTTWDTIVNFQAGDAVTLWGYKEGTSTDGTTDKWYGSDGTPGFTGLTVHAKLDGSTIGASITFAGASLADLSKFAVTTGNVAGNDYMQITRSA